MSRFYGSLDGSARTSATRRGTSTSGVTAHVRGWDIGARTVVRDEHGADVVDVYVTSGSNGGAADVYLGRIVRGTDGAPRFYPSDAEGRLPWYADVQAPHATV